MIDTFKSNQLLTWYNSKESLSFDFETILSKETKIYNGILFCFYDDKLEILVKPHYYFNDNLHNANDFKTTDCIKVVTEFLQTFEIIDYANELRIINIEFGINIIPPIDCKELITFISYHGKNEFRTDTNLPYSKKSYKENKNGTANQYKIIKAYHKGLQFPKYTDKNTFRFEVKSKQSKYINSLGIYSISDLLRIEVYQTISNELLKEWKEVLILSETKNYTNLTTKENNLLNKYLNPNNWYKIKQQHRNQFSKTKKRYFELLEKSGYNIHFEMRKIICEKLNFLTQKGAVSTSTQKIQKGAISKVYNWKPHP